MKASTLVSAAVILAATCSARATLAIDPTGNGNFTGLNATIPDGDPTGYQNSQSFSGLSGSIDNVTVGLDISGGFNGDLVGYLIYQPSSGGPITSLLINQPGLGNPNGGPVLQYFGYSDAGMNVTLDDSITQANGNINSYGGNVVNSGIPTGTFNSAGGTLNSTFNGQIPNGTWTLALFDMSSGGDNTLVSWTLGVDVVPEPVTWALIIFGAVAVPGLFLKRKRPDAMS
jgi:subtilisin-like proprotein convertase family protein